MIKFSVITCTYQAEKELQRTLDSVLMQRYKKVEHLIVDGASTDETVRMAKRYAALSAEMETGHEVVVASEPDHGLYDAMNKGIQKATGDYVLFLNAGDSFPANDTLELVAGSVGAYDVLPAVLYGDTHIVDDKGEFVRRRRLTPPHHLTWRSFLHGMLVCHQAFYARTDIAKVTPYLTKYRYSADVDWCIRIMKEAARRHLSLRNVQAVVVNYLDGGMTNQNHQASLKERFHVMASHYGYLPTLAMHGWFVIRSVFKR